jgi:hypothetical protein
MNVGDLKIDTAEAFASISMDINAFQRLCRYPKSRALLETFEVNVDNFTPHIAEKIELEQWLNIVKFYSKQARYIPARKTLAGMKKMLKTG